MTTPGFVHLHVHTEYSLIDSVVRLPDLVEAVAAAGMPAVAMTDQSNLFGLVKFYREALDAGIKPVIGAEVRVTGQEDQADAARLVLLCRNAAGYRSLSRLLSRAWLEGQDNGVPRVHVSWFDDGAASGLIALSGGSDGVLGRNLLSGPPERAERMAAACMAWFGGDFYVELQRTGRPQDNAYVEAATRFASRMGLPVVATNDVCFLKPDEFDAHEARVCIQQGRTLADPGVICRMGFAGYFLIVADFIAGPRSTRSRWARAAARAPARWWPGRSASPTSIRSATTCCSSAS
jgi:DNA polymerase-3 subunit alpha